MSITDELREFIEDKAWMADNYAKALAIADRIDAEHEAQVADAFETRNSDENLEADGWVKLPVDADGVPIRAGDKVEDACGRKHIKPFVVDSMTLHSGGAWTIRYINVVDLRHHHEPTTEDVLRQLCADYLDVQTGTDSREERELFAEYAKRLQLRGEDA